MASELETAQNNTSGELEDSAAQSVAIVVEAAEEPNDADDSAAREEEEEQSNGEPIEIEEEKPKMRKDEEQTEEEHQQGSREKEDEQEEEETMMATKSSEACSTSSGNSSGSLGIPEEVELDDDPSGEQQLQQEESDFCGETASNSTLRRIKQDTEVDLSVCEQNRQSLEAARRLFGDLERQQHEMLANSHASRGQQNGRRSAPPLVRLTGALSSSSNKQYKARSGSLSSAGSGEEEDEQVFDCGEPRRGLAHYDQVKIVRRSGSSVSSSRAGHYRQTLVCSVSPTRQLDGEGADSSSDLSHHSTADLSQPVYPIEDEEMRQCREAFRQNLRLIQEQQARGATSPEARLSSASSSGDACGSRRSSRVQSILLQRQHWALCSRCQKRVYPLDQLELDFTRTTLQIHRNCFKCQICSTLLRLETYAAMDAKLYCPAHIRSATNSPAVQFQQPQ